MWFGLMYGTCNVDAVGRAYSIVSINSLEEVLLALIKQKKMFTSSVVWHWSNCMSSKISC